MHVCIVVSPMAGVRPEEARAIGWEEDVDLDGSPPSVAVLRADRAGGDTKTPRSRRVLKLVQVAVGALREWRVDQAAEREAAGSRWQDTGRAFTTAAVPHQAGPVSGTDAAGAQHCPVAHSHVGEDEISYLLSGELEFLIGDEAFTVGPEDVVFISRTVRHRFRNLRRPLRHDALPVYSRRPPKAFSSKAARSRSRGRGRSCGSSA